jgi:hypothetical protein
LEPTIPESRTFMDLPSFFSRVIERAAFAEQVLIFVDPDTSRTGGAAGADKQADRSPSALQVKAHA